jgi:hypothetical protein
MTLKEISNTRLVSQMIAAPELKSVKDIVSWMGVIQAQDYSMAKWAIGVRMSDPSEKRIESSLDKGEILRIHVLRPTWHFISADDIYWMLHLSAQKIKSSLRSRHKELELTESVITKTSGIIEKSLSNGLSLTRDELATEFQNAKIKTDANRLSHLLLRAEMDGIVCSGPKKNNKQTYSLLSERIPHKNDLSRDESLAALAKRYFLSRCPATLEDFVWWSNLSITDARKAIDFVRSYFFPETIGSSKYWLPNSFSAAGSGTNSVHLLPAFDEFLISYKDRSISLSLVHHKKTVTDNGIFYPPVVLNGQVAGLWKRTIQKNRVIVNMNSFQSFNKSTRSLIDSKIHVFGEFLNKETEVINMSEDA